MAAERTSAVSTPASATENVEWRLSDFVDAVAAEVDRAQDTLAFKSYARGLSVSLKGLDLDVSVTARMDGQGQVFFRTTEPGAPGATLLKLDFEEVLRTQVEEVRTAEDPKDGQPIETLPGISQAEIDALAALSVTTVEGLLLYARTPAMLRELARKSGVAEVRLRMWLGFPYLSRITPAKGAAGQETVIEGGNLGSQDPHDTVIFPGKPGEILSWSASKIVARVPAGAVSGMACARIDGAFTNFLPWEAASEPPPPPPLKLTALSPAKGTAGSVLSVTLQGTGFSEGITLSFGTSIRVDQVNVEGAGRITARLTLEESAEAGPRDVTVVVGPVRDTLRAGFTVESQSLPVDFSVTGVAPNRGTAGSKLHVDILGSGFQPGAFVSFGPQLQLTGVHSISPTKIRVDLFLPATAVGRHGVTVTNPDKRTITKGNVFEVVAPALKASASRSRKKQE